MQAYRENKGIGPHIINLGTRWMWVVNVPPMTALSSGKSLATHSNTSCRLVNYYWCFGRAYFLEDEVSTLLRNVCDLPGDTTWHLRILRSNFSLIYHHILFFLNKDYKIYCLSWQFLDEIQLFWVYVVNDVLIISVRKENTNVRKLPLRMQYALNFNLAVAIN
jgi:hypothetical protein